MEKENARKQTLEQLHERRKQVVRLHKKDVKIMQIVAMTGLSYPAVRACIDLFDAGGWSAIRPALRGRSRGVGRMLSQAQEVSSASSLTNAQSNSRWIFSFGVGLA